MDCLYGFFFYPETQNNCCETKLPKAPIVHCEAKYDFE